MKLIIAYSNCWHDATLRSAVCARCRCATL